MSTEEIDTLAMKSFKKPDIHSTIFTKIISGGGTESWHEPEYSRHATIRIAKENTYSIENALDVRLTGVRQKINEALLRPKAVFPIET